MSETASLHPTLDRIQRPAIIVGAVGAVGCAVGMFLNTDQFFKSYLFAYLFWVGLALGSFALLMLQHLTGGKWGLAIRRFLEGGTRMLPLMALLVIPLLLPVGMHSLYAWTHEDHAHHMHGTFKGVWLQSGFFIVRTIFYFVIWLVFAFLLNKWSLAQDRTGDVRLVRRMQLISGPGLVLYGLTCTFAAIDWVMSIDSHWFSHIWGVLFMVGQGLSTFAFVIALLSLFAVRGPLERVLNPGIFHDLGNLLFAFTMLWAYIHFSQFLIIWMGNLPEDNPFYYYRSQKGWLGMSVVLIVFHFFVPFLILLNRGVKRAPQRLAAVAVLIIAMRFVDLFWTTRPLFEQSERPKELHALSASIHWLDFAAPLAIGGFWIALYIAQLRRRPLLPPNDPRLLEVAHGHGTH